MPSPRQKKKKADKKQKQEEKKLAAKRDLFCRYYIQNSETRMDGTLSYAAAYGYDLESLSNVNEVDADGKKIPESSPRAKAANVCAVEASRLLRNPKVQELLIKLRNEFLRNDVVDAELYKVITQDEERAAKVQGIREYNKLNKRVTDLVDLTSKGKAIGKVVMLPPRNAQSKASSTKTGGAVAS